MEEHVDKFEKIERMDPDEFIARLYEIYREIPDFHGNIRRIKKAGHNPYKKIPYKAVQWSAAKRMIQQSIKKLEKVKKL